MTKRLIALLLSVIMVVTLLPTGIFAVGETSETGDTGATGETGGEATPTEGEQTPAVKNELIYSTENIDHSWYTLSGINKAIKIIDSNNYFNSPLKPDEQIVNETPIDTSSSADGTVKNMPVNTWAFGYVVEFSGFTTSTNVSLPFGATIKTLDGNEKTCGQGITTGTIANDTQFSVSPGVCLLMTSAMNIYESTPDHRIISQAHELYIVKKHAGTMNIRVLGSVAATVDPTTIEGDKGLKWSSYQSDLIIRVGEQPYTIKENLTKGVLKQDGSDDKIVYSNTAAPGRVDLRETPAFPALTIPKPTAPSATKVDWVNNLVGFATKKADGKVGEATIFYTDNGETITLDSYAREIYPVWRETSNPMLSPDSHDGWFGNGDTVTIPEITETLQNTGKEVWKGNVEFKDPAYGITFIFKAENVKNPIVATKVNPYFKDQKGRAWSWSGAPNLWLWGHTVGKVFCPEMTIKESGIYYLYLNRYALADERAYDFYNKGDVEAGIEKEGIKIQSVQSFNIFDNQGAFPEGRDSRSNDNADATFQMLAVVANDLQPEVNFYDTDGKLLAHRIQRYSTAGTQDYGKKLIDSNDDINGAYIKQTGAVITAQELFEKGDENGEKPADPTPPDDKAYDLVWVNERGETVNEIYKSQNLFAKFVPAKNPTPEATVAFTSFNFTVGNTLALNVNVSCNEYDDTYTECDTWTAYLDVETADNVWKNIDSQTLKENEKAEKVTFNLTGIPAAYISSKLRVRFEGNAKYGVKYTNVLKDMEFNSDTVPITFVNYSKKVKKQEPANEKLKNLLNSMLNYAAEVQKYKGFKAESETLANKDLNPEEQNVMSIDDPNYDWEPYKALKRGITSYENKAVKIKSSQLLLGTDKVGFRFYFNAQGEDVSTLTAKVKYTENGNTVEKDISEFTAVSETNGEYYATFEGLDPTSFGAQVEVSVYKNGELASNTAFDSIPTMAKQVATDPGHVAMRPVLSTILEYSNQAIKYVAK